MFPVNKATIFGVVFLHCDRHISKCSVHNHQGSVVDGEQFIFIQQFYDVMTMNGIVVIMSDIRNFHRFQCVYVHALALPPLLKPTFTYLGITTSFVRLYQSGLQKHSTFDKYFIWLLVSSTLSTALSEKELAPHHQN